MYSTNRNEVQYITHDQFSSDFLKLCPRLIGGTFPIFIRPAYIEGSNSPPVLSAHPILSALGYVIVNR